MVGIYTYLLNKSIKTNIMSRAILPNQLDVIFIVVLIEVMTQALPNLLKGSNVVSSLSHH